MNKWVDNAKTFGISICLWWGIKRKKKKYTYFNLNLKTAKLKILVPNMNRLNLR